MTTQLLLQRYGTQLSFADHLTDFDNGTGTLTLNLPFSDLTVGDTVKAFAGCNHTTEVCDGKFANLLNYGGFPFIPQKNPMDGTIIF